MTSPDRIVVLIDMDCFFCQVEEKLNPKLKGKPVAVVQYNQWQGGGIIAVNYQARAQGVTRHMRGDEAKKKCPDIELAIVPCARGKADTSKYRDAGKEVAHVLQEYTPLLERASVDEAYLDITQVVASRICDYDVNNSIKKELLPETHILGYDQLDGFIYDVYHKDDMDCEMSEFDKNHSLRLLVGAVIVSEIRAAVYEKTGFTCSAGIAHNKTMAKLVCGLNKPNKQTMLPKNSITILFESLPVNKIQHLGGKFGDLVCKSLNISKMKELVNFSEKDLQKRFDEKNGSWLYNIARGTDNEPVTPRFNSKSIGCCKKFPGKGAIVDLETLSHWLKELASEIQDRLTEDSTENNRYPKQMVVSFTKFVSGKDASYSRSANMPRDSFTANTLAANALTLIKKDSKPFTIGDTPDSSTSKSKTPLVNPIKFLGISVGKFENCDSSKSTIQSFFDQMKQKPGTSNTEEKLNTAEETLNPTNVLTNQIENSKDTKISNEVSETDNSNMSNKDSFIVKYLQKLATPTKIPPSTVEFHDAGSNNAIHYDSNSNCSLEDEIKCKPTNSDDNSNDLPADRSRNAFSIDKFFNSGATSPILNNENKVFCEKCTTYIPETEVATHNDYHFALSIREKERQISKPNAIHQKIQNPQPKHNAKRKRNASTAGPSNSILNLFSKIPNQKSTDSENQASKMCTNCSRIIKVSKYQEHLDYHEAKKLQMELNKPVIQSQPESETFVKKRKKDLKNVPNSVLNVRKINTFFPK